MASSGRVLVDSNVILDIATNDPVWGRHSAAALDRLGQVRRVVINPIIYAEVSVGYERIEELNAALANWFEREPLPWSAGFLAGKCFLKYRRRGGKRRSPLPDFYIGAHAAIAGHTLLTRDASRYRTYFPKLELIVPEREAP